MSFDNPFFLFFSVLFNSSFISFGLLHTLSLSLLCSLLLEYKFTRETRKSFDSGEKKTWTVKLEGFPGSQGRILVQFTKREERGTTTPVVESSS